MSAIRWTLLFKWAGARVDRWLGIVGPAGVLTGVPDRGRRLRVLRHPVLPVLVELSAETLGRARRVGRGTGHRQQGEPGKTLNSRWWRMRRIVARDRIRCAASAGCGPTSGDAWRGPVPIRRGLDDQRLVAADTFRAVTSCRSRKSTTRSNGSKPNAAATDGRRFELALTS